MSFYKLNAKIALVFEIFHPGSYNMKYMDQILLKLIRN